MSSLYLVCLCICSEMRTSGVFSPWLISIINCSEMFSACGILTKGRTALPLTRGTEILKPEHD